MTAIIIFFDITNSPMPTMLRVLSLCGRLVPSQFGERRLGTIVGRCPLSPPANGTANLLAGQTRNSSVGPVRLILRYPFLLHKSNAATISSHLPLLQTDCARRSDWIVVGS